jgi:Na+-transporting methylmalonyl-CoA/oxaloacetate decarboxylase gamma subunit
LNETILQGLQISGLGLFITFLALGVFILIMIGLQRLFPGKEESDEVEAVIEIQTDEPGEERAIVAAIAAALTYAEEKGQLKSNSQLGNTLQEPRGGWWQAGRGRAAQGFRRRVG